LGIQPYQAAYKTPERIEIIYRSGDKVMRLVDIHIKDAEKRMEMHGLVWNAYVWRYMDGLSDWDAI
jgi:hypothetical protein